MMIVLPFDFAASHGVNMKAVLIVMGLVLRMPFFMAENRLKN